MIIIFPNAHFTLYRKTEDVAFLTLYFPNGDGEKA